VNAYPQAVVHAFEPFPPSFGQLQEAFHSNSTVHCHNTALSDTCGEAELRSNLVAATNSLLPTHEQSASFWGDIVNTKSSIKVKTTTLDQFCEHSRIPFVHFLKIDVQGHELNVLKGGTQMLKNKSIALAYFEVILAPTYVGQTGLEAIDYMRSAGYELINIFDVEVRNDRLLELDVLFALSS
jgi:FkbM family methyltransferase